MSYDEKNPKKAEFAYQVQRQKSGSRKEQVLHEIEVASERVNDKISTLYWSYIAQEMNHIKKEFTTILGKETEFLKCHVCLLQARIRNVGGADTKTK